MKNIAIAFSIAFLSACSNQEPKSTENVQSTESIHEHHHEEVSADTTALVAGQKVFFENLVDGQEIKLPFVVKFGVEGMEVEPAQGINPNKGHHHLLVNQNHVAAGTMVPMGQEADGYFHFGKGQLSDTLSIKKYPMLKPGTHTLRLQFANGLHQSYGSGMSAVVKVTVK